MLAIFLFSTILVVISAGNAELEEDHVLERNRREVAIQDANSGLDKVESALKKNYHGASNAEQFGKLKSSIDLVRTHLKSMSKSKDIDSVASAINGLSGNLATLADPDADPTVIAATVLTTIAGFASLAPPPVGPAVSVVLSLVAGILGIFSPNKKQKDMGTIVDEIITKRLAEQYKNEMSDEIAGAIRVMSASQEYLEAYRGTNVTRDDIYMLGSNVPIYHGVALLGKLASYIHRLGAEAAVQKDNIHTRLEKAGNAYQMAELYTELTALRQLLLIDMHAVLSHYPGINAAARGAQNVIDNAKREDLKAMKLFRRPNRNQALITAMFYRNQYSADYPGIKAFVKSTNALEDIENLKDGCWTIQNARYTNLYLAGGEYYLKASSTSTKFRFAALGHGITMAPTFGLQPNGNNWCYRWFREYYQAEVSCRNQDGISHQVVQVATDKPTEFEIYMLSIGSSTAFHPKINNGKLTTANLAEEDYNGGSFWRLKKTQC